MPYGRGVIAVKHKLTGRTPNQAGCGLCLINCLHNRKTHTSHSYDAATLRAFSNKPDSVFGALRKF